MIRSYFTGVIFTAVFAVIYNHFGHGVQSSYMNFAWIWPAIGCLASLVLKYRQKVFPESGRVFLACGLTTLTVGSILQGIFEIAGTNSPFVPVFFIVGGILAVLSVPVSLKMSH